MHNLFFKEKKFNKQLRVANFCETKDFYWFTEINYNALYKMGKKTSEVEYVCTFPYEKQRDYLYSKLLATDKKIYCIPRTADSIGVYDFVKNHVESIRLDCPTKQRRRIYNDEYKFFTGLLKKDYLYLFPYAYPAVLRLRLCDNRVEYMYDALDIVDDGVENKEFSYFEQLAVLEGRTWLYSNATGNLYSFDFENMKFNECDWFYNRGPGILTSDDNYLWLCLAREGKILKIDVNKKNVASIEIGLDKFIKKNNSLTRGIAYGEHIYFIPGTSACAVKVNRTTNKVSEAKELEAATTKDDLWKFTCLNICNDRLFAFDLTSESLMIYDKSVGETQRTNVMFDIEDAESLEGMERGFVMSLDGFIDYVERERKG